MSQPSARMLVAFIATSAALVSTSASVRAQRQVPGDPVAVDGRMWSGESSESLPWSDAEAFCETLATAGFGDWRLPTLFELETLHDPDAPGGLRLPFVLADCCAWTSMSLVELEADRKGNLPAPGGAPADYYWGFLFDGGIAYYSNGRFPDGLALCVRTA